MQRLGLIILTLCALAGCKHPMVVPALFADGRIDPFDHASDPDKPHHVKLFYVTDRECDHCDCCCIRYTRRRAQGLTAGHIDLAFGDKEDWPRIVAGITDKPGGKQVLPAIKKTTPYGEMGFGLPQQPALKDNEQPRANDSLIRGLNQALDASTGKAITIHIHGFNFDFDKAVQYAAEYELYGGALGPTIVYSWPSFGSMWQYSHDRDSVRYTTANARRFISLLANKINAGELNAEKINLVSHSSGAEVVGTVLRELALMSAHQSEQDRLKRWRIGSVLMVAPDISTDVARERLLKEDIAGMFEQMVVYTSSSDSALGYVSWMVYRTPRIGSIRDNQLTKNDRSLLLRSKKITVIDNESLPYHGLINHSHHRHSPAVASDILLCLRTNLKPRERGLTRNDGEVIWRFVDNYAQVATDAALPVYGKNGEKKSGNPTD